MRDLLRKRYEVRVMGAGDLGIVLSYHWTRRGAARRVRKWEGRMGYKLSYHGFWAVDTVTGEKFGG